MPERYGPWQSVYGLFRRWQLEGTWAAVVVALQALADAAGHVTWDVSVDLGTVRAQQHAAGAGKDGAAQKEPPGPELEDHGLGRSRGGLTTRFHLAVEQGRKPLAVIVTAGQRGDSPQFIPVLDKFRVPRLHDGCPRTRPDRYLRRRGIRCTTPASRTECGIGRLKPNRAAARYDKLAVRYEATLHVASINERLRPLASWTRPRRPSPAATSSAPRRLASGPSKVTSSARTERSALKSLALHV